MHLGCRKGKKQSNKSIAIQSDKQSAFQNTVLRYDLNKIDQTDISQPKTSLPSNTRATCPHKTYPKLLVISFRKPKMKKKNKNPTISNKDL